MMGDHSCYVHDEQRDDYFYTSVSLTTFSGKYYYIDVGKVAQLPVGAKDVNVGQNGMHIREINKFPDKGVITL